jgi:DNA-binding response OmpR family regulator
MSEKITVLVVDDNARYRSAFSQNLVLQGMRVIQAEHADQALDLLKSQNPGVLVTDLQMRTAREGLDLIRDARAILPCLPVIMISAVGTFDEGAQASKLGAAHVLSKARIEEEITVLYDCIRNSYASYQKAQTALGKIAKLRPSSEEEMATPEPALKELRAILEDPSLDPYVKGEAFDVLTAFTETQLRRGAHLEAGQVKDAAEHDRQENMKHIQEDLAKLLPNLDALEEDTREALRTAEYLYRHGDAVVTNLELSRTICFSFCFAVENQTKASLRKRLTKFLCEESTYDLIKKLQEKNTDHVNMFLQQHLLQIVRDRQLDFTIDNVRQTFLRMLTHRAKYRPDGLKALGIIIIIFGRSYAIKSVGETVRVENPLGIRGLNDDNETIKFAQLLVSLQHFRNPYVHPEISGQQTLSKIRETALECLNMIMRLK